MPHGVRKVKMRGDLVGWVMAGHKRLVTPAGEVDYAAGRVFVIPRLMQ
ncbi:hypothetical protein [Roseateles oligotrophus]|uniref:Uncharacterized protein n=1 Tax=Roseateles oligotrophus TaxID=1769250 RepID=A0ABT2YB80_9BURK|nr:hypothetical protein [Roseateles oligotrophus]MCV2367567.1 hypothetical protein [Roseateles oligotrophus]